MRQFNIPPNVLEGADRDFEVGRLLCQGLPDREIAKIQGRTLRAVKASTKRLFNEYGIVDGHKRIKLAAKLYQYPIYRDSGL